MFRTTPNRFQSVSSPTGSGCSGSSTEPGNSCWQNQEVARPKKKAGVEQAKGLWRRWRDGSRATPEAVEATRLQTNSSQREMPSERQPGGHDHTGSNTVEPGCDLPPSTFRLEEWLTLMRGHHSRAHFDAKYQQFGLLGEGGFGSVYAGQRNDDGLPVAIKHICKSKVRHQSLFLVGKSYVIPVEVLVMLQLTGRKSVGECAAVSLLDWFDVDQEVLVVMERPFPSQDLLTYVSDNGGLVDEDTAKLIVKQLVAAAIETHRGGVFHRDIKLENVLMESGAHGPRVRLIDFGCGCFVNEGPHRAFYGTSTYAPPEFFLRRSYEADPTTVWQVGALLYELLEGNEPFDIAKCVKNELPVIPGVSRDCWDVLSLCLKVRPEKRITLEQLQHHRWFQ